MMNLINRLIKDEEGQGMVEYGLIITLVSLAIIAALTAVGGGLNTIFNGIKAKLVLPAGL